MSAMVDEMLAVLVACGSERAVQAKHDRDTFTREKRGHADRLRRFAHLIPLPDRERFLNVLAQLERE